MATTLHSFTAGNLVTPFSRTDTQGVMNAITQATTNAQGVMNAITQATTNTQGVMNAITQATTNTQGVMNAITQATTNIFTTISTHAADPTTFMSETASDTCLKLGIDGTDETYGAIIAVVSVVLVLVVVCLVLLVLCRMFKNKGTYLTHEAECGDSIRTSDSASLREEPLLELVDEKD